MNCRVVLSLVVLLVATSVSSTGFAAASYCHWDPATNQNVCVNEPYQPPTTLRAGQYGGYAARSSTSTSPCACTRCSPTDYYSSYSSCIVLFRQGARGISGVRTPSGCYAAGGFGSSYYANYPCDSTYAKQYPCYSTCANCP
jgi:hypothetical protein